MIVAHFNFRMLAALAASVFTGSQAAAAENRIALVIGNSAYQSVSPLPNPANDAKAMTALLNSAGFEVMVAPDLTQNDMRQAISEFAAKIAGKGQDSVALVFYAGHGVQVDGENFLVPIDAHIGRESDVPLQALRLNDLMNTLASVPSKTRIVLLDACRNNPFSDINKTTGRGLAIVDAPAGSIVAYSTSPGAEAEDGVGANSPFTTALLVTGREPNLPIEQAFKRVRLSVHQVTEGRQTPWESSSLTSDFFFFPGPGGTTRTPPSTKSIDVWRKQLAALKPQEAYEIVVSEDAVEGYEAFLAIYGVPPFGPRVRSLVERRKEMITWYSAVTINTIASFQAFLASYPNSDLAATARHLMERARNRSLAANAPGSSAPPLVPASPPNRVANATPAATCSCSTPPRGKKASSPPSRRAARVPTDADVFGPGGGPPGSGRPVISDPPVSIGIGVGIPLRGRSSPQPSDPSSNRSHRD
jgi:hypothetical protein